MRYIYLVIFCGVCFLIGVFTSRIFLPQSDIVSDAKPLTPVDKSITLDEQYINGLGMKGRTPQGQKSAYMQKKEEIVTKYTKEPDENVLRSYIYLTSLEGDFLKNREAQEKLCKQYPDTCQQSQTQVSLQGIVKNPKGKALAGILVEILGTEHKTVTDKNGKYSFVFQSLTPTVLRVRASASTTMIGVKRIELVDQIRSVSPVQEFERDFTLAPAQTVISIDTFSETISGKGAGKTETGYTIQTPYTKYLIPFDAIVQGTTPYRGKLKALVFEFDRTTPSYLLDSDAFNDVAGLATQLLVTYGMPYVVFIAEDNTRLDVLSSKPMTLWTTLREKDGAINSPEFHHYYPLAYRDSQIAPPGVYPIDEKWDFAHGNNGAIPLWWVFDRATGFWDNVGQKFLSPNFESPYNIEAPSYTVLSSSK